MPNVRKLENIYTMSAYSVFACVCCVSTTQFYFYHILYYLERNLYDNKVQISFPVCFEVIAIQR